jgi:hypothetical protein
VHFEPNWVHEQAMDSYGFLSQLGLATNHHSLHYNYYVNAHDTYIKLVKMLRFIGFVPNFRQIMTYKL